MKKIAAVNRNALCKPRPYIVSLTKPEDFVRVNNSFPLQINGINHHDKSFKVDEFYTRSSRVL